jgi:hypothetical protein
LEEIVITFVLHEPQANVRSLWHVRQASRRTGAQSCDHC